LKIDSSTEPPVVLVVDDNPRNVQIIALILKELNYKIIIAVNGKNAIEMVNRMRPDLVLMDVMMQGMDGFEACKTIKSDPANENIPVIFLTALSEKINIVKGFEAGGVDYITKPFNKEELISRIKTHLELKFTRDELQKTTQHLGDLNEIKDKMFSVIGHDLRSPIGSIKMTLDLLICNQMNMKDAEFMETINLLNQTSDEVFSLLENLLGWAKSQSGNIKIQTEKLNLKQLTSSLYLLHKSNIHLKKIKFENHIDDEIAIQADQNTLMTILRNLLSNAIKFTPEGGNIKFLANQRGKMVDITVVDNGIGIPAGNLSKLFDEKQFLTTYGTNNEAGSGLGLILCQSFAHYNNGQIRVESEHGKGSKFIVEMPSAN